ncbi:MAG TPA: sigma-70 family RNA polymerase sigma factor [Ktedonobacterales bacterium]|nr:sigma-70 family RNA polymerase sigma factor [Ktedonobacterales bacterium]
MLTVLATSRMWGQMAIPQSTARSASTVPGVQPHDFVSFFLAHEPAVSGFLWRRTGDEQTANDLSQETFLRAWQGSDRIRTYDKSDAWLFRVATKLALHHLRRGSAPIGAASQFDEEQGPNVSDPAGHFAEHDLVRETLLELPSKARALLILRAVYGLPGKEMCDALKMSPEAVKAGRWRARQQFRNAYMRKERQP